MYVRMYVQLDTYILTYIGREGGGARIPLLIIQDPQFS